MFLAINLNTANAKKRKKEAERAAKQLPDGVREAMDMEMTSSIKKAKTTTTRKLSSTHNSNIDKKEAAVYARTCKNCQHFLLDNEQLLQQQLTEYKQHTSSIGDELLCSDLSRLPLTNSPCTCDCNCSYKEQQPIPAKQHRDSMVSTTTTTSVQFNEQATKPTSLFTVYICLGILACSLATLAMLFFSHISTTTTTTTTTMEIEYAQSSLNASEFHAQFQRELAASKQLLRDMLSQLLLAQQQQQHYAMNRTAANVSKR